MTEFKTDLLESFAESIEAQLSFKPGKPAGTSNRRVLAIWDRDHMRKMPVMISTRKLDLGTPEMKFFRRVRVVGDGEVFMRVIVDGRVVLSDVRIVMREGHGAPAFLSLPRGCAGRWIVLEFAGQVVPTSFDLEFDPIK